MNIFGDAIDDKLFPKPNKRFTDQEKNLIENFFLSIMKKDKDSELLNTKNEILYDREGGVTDEITKAIILFEEKYYTLTFYKLYDTSWKKDPYYNGRWYDKVSKNENLKSVNGIFFKGYGNFEMGWGEREHDHDEEKILLVRTEYEGGEAGIILTKKSLENVEKNFFKDIKDSIFKAKRNK